MGEQVAGRQHAGRTCKRLNQLIACLRPIQLATSCPALQAHKAASDAHTARQELAAAQQRLQDYKAALSEAQAEVAAARVAEQRLQQQLAGEQRRCEKVGTGGSLQGSVCRHLQKPVCRYALTSWQDLTPGCSAMKFC